MNHEEASRLGCEDAQEAIEIARSSGDDPIAWITGNAYMPPLRAFGRAEYVWEAQYDVGDEGETWDAYVETFEHVLDENKVYLGSPDYDNALYVVDLARFEYDETGEDGEFLQDEWRKIN